MNTKAEGKEETYQDCEETDDTRRHGEPVDDVEPHVNQARRSGRERLLSGKDVTDERDRGETNTRRYENPVLRLEGNKRWNDAEEPPRNLAEQGGPFLLTEVKGDLDTGCRQEYPKDN